MSPLAKHFIEQGIRLMQINEYLRSELVRAGFAGIELQKTPLGTRITLKTSRPGLVIGKGGKRIQEITDVLQERFDLELPQIEVEEVPNPDLDAQIMAERLAYSLDRGRHYRRAGYYILRKVMDAGARGVEIIISGKVTSQRARTQIFRAGTMSKSGQPAQIGVDKGVAQCIQKSGVLGIIVKIMRADTVMGDEIKIKKDLLAQAQAKKESEAAKTRLEKKAKKKYEIVEEEGVLSEEDKALLDEVDEEDISEISLEPTDKAGKKKKEKIKRLVLMGDILKADKIREMDERERERTLIDLREQLMLLYSSQTGGGLSDNPAKAKILKKQIARVLTVINEERR